MFLLLLFSALVHDAAARAWSEPKLITQELLHFFPKTLESCSQEGILLVTKSANVISLVRIRIICIIITNCKVSRISAVS